MINYYQGVRVHVFFIQVYHVPQIKHIKIEFLKLYILLNQNFYDREKEINEIIRNKKGIKNGA